MGMFEETKNPRLFSHRGFTPVAPENSLASFTAAGRLGYWGIETDIRKSKDGVLVCCHDAMLTRMFGVPLKVEETDWAELRRQTFQKGNGLDKWPLELLRIPTFDEYLDICQRFHCVPFLETKGEVVADVIKRLEERKIINETVFSSIIIDHIREARRLNKEIFIHHIFSTPELMEELAELGNSSLSYNYPNPWDAPVELLEETHRRGVRYCLRAGDKLPNIKKMVELKVDYIPTNCIAPWY